MDGLVVGKLVHYVPPNRGSRETCRGAIITRIQDQEEAVVNLAWYRDNYLDGIPVTEGQVAWAASVSVSPYPESGTWHPVHEGELPPPPAPELVTTLDLEPPAD